MRNSTLLLILLIIACSNAKHITKTTDETKYLIRNDAIRETGIDPLGNIYILDAQDRLTKFDTAGHFLFDVVKNDLGEAWQIDVDNPFKTMIFYKDHQTILLLDRTLSEILRIRLNDLDYHDVTAACLSPDNKIWIFDGTTKSLIKLDDAGNALLTSDPFDIMKPGSARPGVLHDVVDFILAREPGHPISVFDDFGHYLYDIQIEDEASFSVSGNYILQGYNQSIMKYDPEHRQFLTSLPVHEDLTHRTVYEFAGKYYITDSGGVYVVKP